MKKANRSGRILIVDDTSANLVLLNEMLSGVGYTVSVANCGVDALESARLVVPDMVLLDILMPGMDGYEVLTRLKADPSTARIPVLLLSALDGTESKTKGFELGACDYVTKPFHMAEVLARMDTHLRVADLERRLRWSEAAMREAESVAGIGTWTFDPKGCGIQWSDELYRLLGVDPSQGRTIMEILEDGFSGEDLRRAREMFANPVQKLSNGASLDLVFSGDGERSRILRAKGKMIHRPGPEDRALFVGVLQDVSGWSRRHEDGDSHESRARRILQRHPDGYLRIDAAGRILESNRSILHWLGVPEKGLVGGNLADLDVPGSSLGSISHALSRAVNSGGGASTFHLSTLEGPLPVEMVVVPEDDGGMSMSLFLRPRPATDGPNGMP